VTELKRYDAQSLLSENSFFHLDAVISKRQTKYGGIDFATRNHPQNHSPRGGIGVSNLTIEIVFLRSFNETIFNAINGLVGTIIGLIVDRKV